MKTMQNSSAVVRDLNGLESHLLSKIKGQNDVIARVCSALELGQLGLQPIDKPLGSFLFLGPTGVGKTELTLEFTRYLFGGNEVYRFDMSEFLHLDNVSCSWETKPAPPDGSGTFSRSTSKAFCFSMKSKRPPVDMGSLFTDARCRPHHA